MANTKLNILCTRMLDKELIYKAADKNIDIDELPFIEIKLLNAPEIVNEINIYSPQNINVIFTSRNAVEAIAEHVTNKPNWKIYSTGGTTKDLAIEIFGKDKVIATAKSATALAEKIIALGNVKDAVFFCGDQRLNEIPEMLAAENIAIKELVVYENKATPHFINKNYDAVIFFSPSAVHSFFGVNTLPVHVQLFSIGRTTTSIIQTYCTNPTITSEWPGKEHMVDMIIEHYGR